MQSRLRPGETSSNEVKLLEYLNGLRTQRTPFINRLTKEFWDFRGNSRLKKCAAEIVRTRWGSKAWKEAILELKTAPRPEKLKWNDGLALVAKSYCKSNIEASITDEVNRYGTLKSGPKPLLRAAKGNFASDRDLAEVILDMFVDHEDPRELVEANC